MPRIRSIKPELPQSESLGRVSREARYCFVLLITQADDEGRLRGHSRMLASLLYPYDDDARGLIEGWLDELERENCIQRYEADGNHYIQIVKWLEHQKVDHPSKSKIPAFSEEFAKPREASRSLAPDQGSRIKDQGSEDARETRVSLMAGFEEWWEVYPNKVGKAAAQKSWIAARRKVEPEALMAGLKRYIASKPPDRPWCNPATWLNQDRWLDQPAPAVNGRPGETGSLINPEVTERKQAAAIAKGIRLASVPDGRVWGWVAKGWLTAEQASKAGYVA